MKLKSLTGTIMIHKQEAYHNFCRQQKNLPLFMKDWWLDAVCGNNNWEAVMVQENNKIVAAMPFYKVRKSFLDQIVMPPLTQHIGPWINYPPDQKKASKLSFEKKVLAELIEKLPDYDRLLLNFSCSLTNWLPFYWHGYSQTTKYTYQIQNLSSLDVIWSGLKSNIRREIRKAQKNVKVFLNNNDVDRFYQVNTLSFQRQGKKNPISFNLFKKVHQACSQHESCQMFFAKDKQDRIHAVLYIVWDERSCYYLMGGGDPALRNSGASSLLMWEAIQFASKNCTIFDFEGSMLPSVERFFCSFGAEQVPYFQVSKANSKLFKIAKFIKEL